MKKIILLLALMMIFPPACTFAQDYDDPYSRPASGAYETGVQLLKTQQFSKAIIEFKKALRENPNDESSKIQITNAYLARAAYYNNRMMDYKNAANDLRSALFYLKYYSVSPVDAQTLDNITITENNLRNVLSAINADMTPKGRYNAGKSLRAQGEFAAAVTEFQAAQSDAKCRKDALVALGEIYYILNLNDQAATYLERALYDDPKDANTHLKLARVYERMGSADKAAKEYTLALTKSSENQEILLALENIWKQKAAATPDDADVHANLGAIYQKRGNLDSALAEYQLAEKLNPSSVMTRLNHSTLYQQKKEYETAIEGYDSILRLYPNHTLAYYYKAQCLRALGMKDAAVQNYKLALNLEPENQGIKDELFDMVKSDMTPEEMLAYLANELKNSPNNPETVYEYAYQLHKNKKFDEAITYYNQVIQLDPKNSDAYLNIAAAYKQKSQFDKAKEILNQGKSLFPEIGEFKKQLAILNEEEASLLYSNASDLFKKGKYQEAINLYSKITPMTPEALVGIGASYQAMKNYKSAAENFKKSLDMEPNNADTAYYLALAYSNAQDLPQAKIYAKKALEIEPNNKNAKELLDYVNQSELSAYLEQADKLYTEKKYPEALVMLGKVLAMDPKNASAHYSCGLINDELKKYWPAIESYKKAVQNDPSLAIAYYSIAVDYDTLQRYQQAVANYKLFVANEKADNEYTQYAKQRIQELKQYDTP